MHPEGDQVYEEAKSHVCLMGIGEEDGYLDLQSSLLIYYLLLFLSCNNLLMPPRHLT